MNGLAIQLMTGGGDARLHLNPMSGLNRYHSAPRPSGVLAFSSSTANDISKAAFAHVEAVLAALAPDGEIAPETYAAELERMRSRIRAAYGVPRDVEIVFAPSGTDLEYVALACRLGKGSGTRNLLLGADEVGSGCIHSAHGRYFAEATALGVATRPGAPVPGLSGAEVELIDIPVRDDRGHARPSADIGAAIEERLARAADCDLHALVHVVHGSKTGLILPALDEIDWLRARHGERATFVVDACQARITPSAVADYMKRGMILFITGSKFMGGPPFSGFALIPAGVVASAGRLPLGLATIFRRPEWPASWPGIETLPNGANLGLLLRLEASLFELERYRNLPPMAVERVILAFHQAIRAEIVEPLGIRRVAPYPPGDRREADDHPVEMRTLSTLDLSGLGDASLEDAQNWHRRLLEHGVRLGQPVKCVKLADGSWGATLRIALSMPIISERIALDAGALERSFAEDMRQVATAVRQVTKERALKPEAAMPSDQRLCA